MPRTGLVDGAPAGGGVDAAADDAEVVEAGLGVVAETVTTLTWRFIWS